MIPVFFDQKRKADLREANAKGDGRPLKEGKGWRKPEPDGDARVLKRALEKAGHVYVPMSASIEADLEGQEMEKLRKAAYVFEVEGYPFEAEEIRSQIRARERNRAAAAAKQGDAEPGPDLRENPGQGDKND